jgi:CTP synthase
MPYLGASGEFKTKPAQNSVRDLRGLGITPDVLVCRSESQAPSSIKRKLSLFSAVAQDAIALLPNAPSIYEVPLTIEDTKIVDVITKRLDIKTKKPQLGPWREVVKRATTKFPSEVTVGVVAKYMDNQDTYMSVFEALRSAAWWNDTNVKIKWIDAEAAERGKVNLVSELEQVDAVVVPGGFGTRALEGKIKAAQYCLSSKKPYLGLCLGLQMGVIAAARNAGLGAATTPELDPNTKEPVVYIMDGQEGKLNTGGTMRLGDYPCVLQKDSKAAKAYGTAKIVERHRHRFECNNAYRDKYESWGIRAVGTSPDGKLVEVIEATDHPYFLASQFHPEFKSRPNRPHPLFDGLIKAALQ